MKRVLLILTILISLLGISGLACGETVKEVKPKAKYTIGITEWIPWAVFVVAEEKGYFKKQGVDVNVITFPSCYENVDSFYKGKVDICVDMLGVWASHIYKNEHDFVVLSAIDFSSGGDKVILRKGTNIDDVKNIYVYSDMLATLYFLDRALQPMGKSIKDFNISQYNTDFINTMIKSGKADMAVSYEPDALAIADSNNPDSICEVVSSTADIPGVMPEGMCIKRDTYNKMDKSDLRRIYRALFQAMEWTKNPKNEKALDNIVRDKFFFTTPKFTDAEIKGMMSNAILMTKPEMLEYTKPGGGIYKYFTDVEKMAKSNGKLVEVDIKKHIDTTEFVRVLREVDRK